MIGHTTSHYRITEKLGGGGMGVVYKAEDTTLKRTVALKFLHPELTRDDDAKQRFVQEAQAASALQHNNICTIHDIGETGDGQMFMVMDLYEGETLKKKIERGPLELEEAIDIAAQIARGLAKAHEKGIVHRDIKPANILVTNEGIVKVVDFGLAKLLGAQQITKEGRTVGTTMYMSPEQVKGEEIDALTDIWSFGVLLYQMCTGQLPFRAEFDEAVIYQINCEQPPPIASLQPDIPKDLCELVAQCLEKEKNRRPRSMEEILERLGHGTEHRLSPFRLTRPTRASFIAGIIVVSLALIYYFSGDLEFTAPPKELRLAVLTFVDETKDTAIVGYKPEIQRLFVNALSEVDSVVVEDRLRFNAALVQEFGTDNPPRNSDLFSFLRKSGYDFVADGSITKSPTGGQTVEVDLRKEGDFESVQKISGRFQTESQLDSVVKSVCGQVIAFLKVGVLNINPEMGVWKGNRPKNWGAVAKLEDAYKFYCEGERGSAIDALREAVQLDSMFISPRIWLASYCRKREPEEAKRHLQFVLNQKAKVDDFERAMINWMKAYLEYDFQNQKLWLERALQFAPKNRILLANLAGTYLEMHDTLHVLEAYQYCIDSHWQFKLFYPIAVQHYLGQRNFDAAKKTLLIWRDVDTVSVSPTIYGWLMAVHLRMGDSVQAARSKDQFHMASGHLSVSRIAFTLGGCLVDAGIFSEGEPMLRTAVALEKNNAEYREKLGCALLGKGDTAAALNEFNIVSKINPQSTSTILRMGNIFKQKGDTARALEQFQKYMKWDSVGYDAQQIQIWIKGLVR